MSTEEKLQIARSCFPRLKTLVVNGELIRKGGILRYFKGIPSIYVLTGGGISDKEIKEFFTGVKVLHMNSNKLLTDKGLEYLGNSVEDLNVSHNEKITDKGLSYLKKITKLNITDCPNITDEGLKYLVGIKELIAKNNKSITDEGLKFLEGSIHLLDISGNGKITNIGMVYLKGIKTLKMSNNDNISTEGFKHLKGIRYLCVSNLNSIENEDFIYLQGLWMLQMSEMKNISNDAMKYLKGIKRLQLFGQDNINDYGLYLIGSTIGQLIHPYTGKLIFQYSVRKVQETHKITASYIGTGTQYFGDYILYKGEFVDGLKSRKGKEYWEGTNVIKKEGIFYKDDLCNGKLYNKLGEKINEKKTFLLFNEPIHQEDIQKRFKKELRNQVRLKHMILEAKEKKKKETFQKLFEISEKTLKILNKHNKQDNTAVREQEKCVVS